MTHDISGRPPGSPQGRQLELDLLLDAGTPIGPAAAGAAPDAAVLLLPAQSGKLVRQGCAAALARAMGEQGGPAPLPWLDPPTPGEGWQGWIGLQEAAGRQVVLLGRHSFGPAGEHWLLLSAQAEPLPSARWELHPLLAQGREEALAWLVDLCGNGARSAVALPAGLAASWARLLAAPASDGRLPPELTPAELRPASTLTAGDAADWALQAQTPELLEVPAYHGWSLDGLGLEVPPELLGALDRWLSDTEAADAWTAPAPYARLDLLIDPWLRAGEGAGLPDLLHRALRHNAWVHRQAGNPRLAGLAAAAAASLRLGLALVDHPFARQLARRTALRLAGRAGRTWLTRMLGVRLERLVRGRLPAAGPRRGALAEAGRRRRILASAVLLRGHPAFGEWLGGPEGSAALDRLALELACRLVMPATAASSGATLVVEPLEDERRLSYRRLLEQALRAAQQGQA